ncbi:GntR family transcriptional regulator [Caldimonas brevitalea]|uniref:GntR family transcriptional regulator n=1 Tax=Caldimonas brevitalea TaxID=413882 RepID=A0A0G3BV27_9BURK|nr:GntR family transcriptional regulator [Caldimonas brevitalea]AKJ31256.1 GntR family transcriptional regulator [Caldimonas brevitalea]
MTSYQAHVHPPGPGGGADTLPAPLGGRRPVTLYSRIREDLRARILSGAWQAHDRIPSESALMAQYGVSRITVRQALGDLEKERLIFKVPGKGSFVAQTKPFQELGRLQGFAEAMGALGHEIYNRVLSVTTQAAPAQVADRLHLAPGAPVTEIRRVRHLDRQPVSLDLTWVPVHIGQRLADADLATRDIFVILENDQAIPLGHADLVIDAETADPALANWLGIAPGDPVLHIERLTHTRDGVPIDYEHLYCRADNFQYRLRLQRR